jgi:hypothetical protein
LIEKLAMPAGIVTDAGKPPGPGGKVGVTVRLTGMSVAAGAVRVNISVRTLPATEHRKLDKAGEAGLTPGVTVAPGLTVIVMVSDAVPP